MKDIFLDPPCGLSLEDCLDFHHQQNSNHAAFIYSGPDEKSTRLCSYTEFVAGVHRAGRFFLGQLQLPPVGRSPLVVGIIVQTDSLTNITILAGLMRAGITAFPISYRFSSTIIVHLLDRCRPAAIVVDSTTKLLVVEAIDGYENGTIDPPVIIQLPALTMLYPGHNEYIPLPKHTRKPEDPSVLVHSSSSSSGFPNVVPWSSLAISHHGQVEEMPHQDLCGKILMGCGLELFHSLTMCIFFMVVRKGLVLSFPNPWNDLRTSQLANDHFSEVIRCIELIKPNFIVTNARVIEIWAESPRQIDILRTCGANVFYGGSFLNKPAGDKLVANGVRLCTAYGSTEIGPIAILPHFQEEDWEYFAVKPRPDVVFMQREDRLFEVVVSPIEGEINYLAAFNTTWQDRPAYNPGDLFIAHPIKSNTYKMFGRMSDQILLSSGETINPIKVEAKLTSNALVTSAVMFGHRRARLGVIIEPVRSFVDSQGAEDAREDFRDTIWPSIEEANLTLPPHSKISRTMIVVATKAKPISMSLKGLPRRALVWRQYQNEIDDLYKVMSEEGR